MGKSKDRPGDQGGVAGTGSGYGNTQSHRGPVRQRSTNDKAESRGRPDGTQALRGGTKGTSSHYPSTTDDSDSWAAQTGSELPDGQILRGYVQAETMARQSVQNTSLRPNGGAKIIFDLPAPDPTAGDNGPTTTSIPASSKNQNE